MYSKTFSPNIFYGDIVKKVTIINSAQRKKICGYCFITYFLELKKVIISVQLWMLLYERLDKMFQLF